MARITLKDELGFFVAIPERLFEMASEIGSDAVFMYSYLRYRMNREREEAWPGYDRMRADIGWGRTRIATAIQVLEDNNLITRRRRFGNSTVYTLLVPPDVGVSDEETAISPDSGLMENVISPKNAPSLVPKTDLTQDSFNQDSVKRDSRPDGRNEQDRIRKIAEKTFIRVTRLPPPDMSNKKREREAGELWWAPLRRICVISEWKENVVIGVIEEAVRKMRLDGLTVSSPKSIVRVCEAIIGEVRTEKAKKPRGG